MAGFKVRSEGRGGHTFCRKSPETTPPMRGGEKKNPTFSQRGRRHLSGVSNREGKFTFCEEGGGGRSVDGLSRSGRAKSFWGSRAREREKKERPRLQKG